MRSRRTLAALAAATLASVCLVAQPASAATASPALVVAPEDGGVVRSGQDLGVDVAVTNPGTASLPAGRIQLSLEKQPVASSDALLADISNPPEVLLGDLAVGATAAVPALDGHGTTTAHVTVKQDVLSSILSSASGARILYARYRAGSGATTVQTVAESVVVAVSGSSRSAVGMSVVIPLLAPAGDTGLVDTAEQQRLVQPGGAWAEALQAAQADPKAAIALDPAVIASIRLAGTAAPPDASAFLEELRALPNEFLRLPYADTDLTLARAAGADGSLDPTSFAGASVASTATPTPTPAPMASAGSSSASTDVLSWNWSDRRVAWPMPGTSRSADLSAFGNDGEQVLLSSADLQDTAARASAGPLARVGGTGVLVSDATVSALVAAASADGTTGASALATLAGVLATAAVTGETTGYLATAGRSGAAVRLDRVLDLLGNQSWVRPTGLTDLGDTTRAPSVQLRSVGALPASRVSTARGLVEGEQAVRSLGTAVQTDAAVVTAPSRLALLGAMSAAWRGDDAGWTSAADATEAAFGAELRKVSLVKGAESNAIGNDGHLSVVVVNALPEPVKVVVRASVSNGRLQFTGDSAVTVTVPANASNNGRLAFRTITNGSTDVALSLETPSGVPIGPTTTRSVTVSAGFDTIVAIVLLIALALLLALGVYRNITRRRRHPRTAAPA